MTLQMAYFDRGRGPVITDFGPSWTWKTSSAGRCAPWPSRAYERDYVDTAAVLARYSAGRGDRLRPPPGPGPGRPGLRRTGQRLDRMPDEAFTSFGLSGQDVARLRERFAAWPREPDAVAADIADDTGRHPGQARQESARAAEAAAGPARDRHDVRQAEPEEPEIEP